MLHKPRFATDNILLTFKYHRPNELGVEATTGQIYRILTGADHHRPNVSGPRITTGHILLSF